MCCRRVHAFSMVEAFNVETTDGAEGGGMKNNMMSVWRSAGVRSLIFIVAFVAAGGDAFASFRPYFRNGDI